MEQCECFEQEIAPITRLIVLECSDQTIATRLGSRSRFDDAAENISRRIQLFKESTSKVIERLEKAGKVTYVDAEEDVEEVGRRLRDAMKGVLPWRAVYNEERAISPHNIL